jgi:ABC-2 type transport system permease protein
MALKEISQLSRDKITLIMQIAVPVVQLLLIGYAINYNPRHLPTAVVSADRTQVTREILSELKNSSYFKFIREYKDIKQARDAMQRGEILYLFRIPPNFTADFFHHNKPQILIEADNSNPVAVASGLSAVTYLRYNSLKRILQGPLSQYQSTQPQFEFVTHARYNPEDITAYGTVPGLVPLVVFVLLISMCALTIVRERESGTMESLLVKPIKPSEVLIGKILPYVVIGYLQMFVLLLLAKLLFHIPMQGSLVIYFIVTFPFLLSGLAIGIVISSYVKNQLQSLQLTIFVYLPNVILTGFAFPFYGMPGWAQVIGNILPLTHFVRISRDILLKGDGWVNVWPDLWPIILFATVLLTLSVFTYRKKLD